MSRYKLDLLFAAVGDSPEKFEPLGGTGFSGEFIPLSVAVPGIGERVDYELNGTSFGGRVVDKHTTFASEDSSGEAYDTVITVMLWLKLDGDPLEDRSTVEEGR